MRKYWFLCVIASLGVVLDQVTKHWAKALEGQPPVVIVPGFFNLVYVENKGAAWGMFSNLSEGVRIPFFVVISVFAIGFVAFFFKRLKPGQTLMTVALSCVLGGALGNFIDRMVYNSVIDFVDWFYGRFHWPTFNVADIFITVGIGLLALEMLFGHSEFSLRRPAESSGPPPAR